MKYIRTKGGRIINRVSDFHCFKSHGTTGRYIVRELKDDNDLELWLKYNSTSIFKQADTIEELCDEFVVITEIYRKVSSHYDCEYEIERYKNKNKTNNRVIAIYGAIWTDKGLIYVAKMNDKGELELL